VSERFAAFCIRRRLAVVTAIGLATVVLALFAARMEIKTVFADLLPTRHDYIQIHNRFKDTFGGANIVSIMITAREGDVFQRPVLEKVHRLQRDLQQVPAVNQFQIISLASRKLKEFKASTDGVDSNPLMWPDLPDSDAEIAELRDKVLRNELIYGVYVSQDLKSTLVTVDFYDHSVDYGVVFDRVSSIIAGLRDDSVHISVVGDPILFGWVRHYLPETLYIALVGIGVLVTLLFLINRTWRGTLLPMLAGTVSAIWALGSTRLLGFHFDPLVIVVAMLVTARAVSHSVQVITRFHEEVENVESGRETSQIAARVTMAELFRPGMLGIGTDAACVAVVAISPIPLLQKLTVLAVVWLLTVAVTAIVLTPVLLSWIRHPRGYVHPLDVEGWAVRPFLHLCAAIVTTRARYLVLALAAFIFAVSAYFSLGIKVGDANPGSPILWPDSTYNTDSAFINEKFPGADRMFVVVAGHEPDAIKKTDVLLHMNRFQRFMEAQPQIGGTISLADALPSIHRIMREGNPRYLELGEDQLVNGELLYLLDSLSDPGDLDRYVDTLAQNGSVTLFFRDRQGDTIRTAVARIREFLQANPLVHADYALAGGVIGVLAAVNEVILKDQIKSIALALLILVVACATVYRSPMAGMFFMTPVILSNTVTFAFMAWMNIGMNINTVPVAAIGIGLGVDYALYICDRIKFELERQRVSDPLAAITTAVHTAGRGVLVTAIVLSAAIVVWMWSSLRFQAEMAGLMTLWLAVSAFAALFVMPALANVTRPRFLFGENAGLRVEPAHAPAVAG